MKRTPLSRRTPLKRGTGPKRRKRLSPWGRRWKRRKEAGEVDERLRNAARESGCWVTGAPPPSDAHHVREKGESKVDWREGVGRVVPFNHDAHMDWHGLSEAKWETKYGFARPTKSELGALAAEFGRRFREQEAA